MVPAMSASFSAAADVVRSPALRRAQAAWALQMAGDSAYLVALGLFAYRAGGPAAVGFAGLVLMVPGAATAPFGSLVADRFRRERVVLAVGVGRSLLLAATAVCVLADASSALVYALAAVGSVVAAVFRPAYTALIPELARTPRELIGANVGASTTEGLASVAGPAVAGVVFAAAGAGPAFALAACLFLASGLSVLGIDSGQQPTVGVRGGVAETLKGFRHAAGDHNARLLLGLFGVQTLVRGALTTLLVLVSLELLGLGEAGVGILNAALGVGGVLGGLVALSLVGRQRLGGAFALGLACWGLPIALIGVWPEAAVALVLLAAVGVGNTVVDVAGMTLLQRLTASDLLARLLGVLESVVLLAIGLGAFAAPFLVDAVGLRAALLITGSVLPVAAALSLRALARADAAARVPARELAVARAIDLFAALPWNVVEQLARGLVPVRYPPGAHVVTQSESGEQFYVLTEGTAEVRRDGQTIAALGPGDYFGEIALLRDVPRTADVTARTEIDGYALGRDQFVAAVAGHRRCSLTAETVIETRLGRLGAAA